MNKQELDRISGQIIGAAIAVHKELGPGLLESCYESCLAFELTDRGVRVETQKVLPLIYRGHNVDCGFRIDMLVEDHVIVELKTADGLLPIHQAQLITYLKLYRRHLGLLISFNVPVLTQGIKRLVHGSLD